MRTRPACGRRPGTLRATCWPQEQQTLRSSSGAGKRCCSINCRVLLLQAVVQASLGQRSEQGGTRYAMEQSNLHHAA